MSRKALSAGAPDRGGQDRPRELFTRLSLPIQSVVLITLWVAWLALTAWVFQRAREVRDEWRRFENEYAVYTPLLVGLPAVLVALGLMLFVRERPADGAPVSYHACYWLAAMVTGIGVIVLIGGGSWALQQTGNIRE